MISVDPDASCVKGERDLLACPSQGPTPRADPMPCRLSMLARHGNAGPNVSYRDACLEVNFAAGGNS